MAITKDSNFRQVYEKKISLVKADLTSAVAAEIVDLPSGAEVVGGYVNVTEVFNSTTSDVLDVGDKSSANRYKNDVNLQALGVTNLIPTGYKADGDGRKMAVTWVSGGGSPSTGKAEIVVLFVMTDSSVGAART